VFEQIPFAIQRQTRDTIINTALSQQKLFMFALSKVLYPGAASKALQCSGGTHKQQLFSLKSAQSSYPRLHVLSHLVT
jgi:hypothetical protein